MHHIEHFSLEIDRIWHASQPGACANSVSFESVAADNEVDCIATGASWTPPRCEGAEGRLMLHQPGRYFVQVTVAGAPIAGNVFR